MQQAVEENPFVPAYLMGQKRVPNRQVDYYGWGDESEAVYYASEHLNHWRRIPAAVDWLRVEIATGPQGKQPRLGSRLRRTQRKRGD